MTVKVPGYSTLTGTPETILRVMQTANFIPSSESPEEYLQCLRRRAEKFFGVRLEVTGNTYAERAESLLRSLAKNNLIELID